MWVVDDTVSVKETPPHTQHGSRGPPEREWGKDPTHRVKGMLREWEGSPCRNKGQGLPEQEWRVPWRAGGHTRRVPRVEEAPSLVYRAHFFSRH